MTTVENGFTQNTLNWILSSFLTAVPFELNLGSLNVQVNITNVDFSEADVVTQSQTSIIDNGFIYNLTNGNVDLNISYEYLSDPPLFADFGQFYFKLVDMYSFVNVTSKYNSFNGSDFILNNISLGL